MFVNIDKNFVLGGHGMSPNIGLIEGNQIKSPLGQSVATESERFGIEEITMDSFNPAGLTADVPRCANVARAILEFYCNSVSCFKLTGL